MYLQLNAVYYNHNYGGIKMKIGEKFLLGGAISASQCEGAYNLDGKGLSVFDTLLTGRDRVKEAAKRDFTIEQNLHYPSHFGIDFYHTYKTDLMLMKELGFNAFRFSINWCRIFPTGEEEMPNEKGLLFYDNLINECLRLGLEPIVTMLHYEIPMNLVKKYGGFSSRKVVEYFGKYAKAILDRFNDKVKYWITINEINIAKYSPIDAGCYLSNIEDNLNTIYQIAHNQFIASAIAVIYGKSINSSLRFGMMLGYEPVYAETNKPLDVLLAQELEEDIYFYSDIQINGYYSNYNKQYLKHKGITIAVEENDDLTLMKGKVDFLSFSYYSSATVSSDANKMKKAKRGNIVYSLENKNCSKTPWGWTIDEIGLKVSINRLYSRYRIPLMIAECGIGMDDIMESDEINDIYRMEFYEKHLKQVNSCIENGIEVMGFMCWAPIDLVSAASGEMKKRYGFVYVDLDNDGNGTNKRYKKNSFYWMKNNINKMK